MASTYTPLGVELQATGENAGTWGTKTNTNLQIIEQISGGYIAKSIAGGAQTTALSVSDGSTGAELSHRMIEFTGTITGNQIVTIPLDVQTFYFLRNSTSGAYTVQFKYASGSGDSFTFSATDKGDAIVFATASDGTNPNIDTINTGIASVAADTTPQLGGNLDTNSHNILIDDAHFIADENGNEQVIFQTTSSAVNQFDITNAATGNPPKISTTGGDSNIDLDLEAKGTGHLTVRGNTNSGAIQLNCESNSHGQQIKAQPHSASVTNTMLLPAGADSTLVSLVSTDTLTNKTLTSPKIGTKIDDTNGNELVNLTATSSAVNEFTIANAATGNNPSIAASGGDTNVGLEFTAKGAGYIKFNDLAYIPQQALTSSSNAVAWDVQAKPNAYHLTTENTTFSAPTNSVEGSFICLEINYNGSHTIAFNTIFEFAASTAPTFTSTDGKTDILVFRYNGAVWQEVGRTLNLSES
jgi:hypothetical protein